MPRHGGRQQQRVATVPGQHDAAVGRRAGQQIGHHGRQRLRDGQHGTGVAVPAIEESVRVEDVCVDRQPERSGSQPGEPFFLVVGQRPVHRRDRADAQRRAPSAGVRARRADGQRGHARRVESAAHHHRGRLAPQPIVDGLLQDLAEVRDDGARVAHACGAAARRTASRPTHACPRPPSTSAGGRPGRAGRRPASCRADPADRRTPGGRPPRGRGAGRRRPVSAAGW